MGIPPHILNKLLSFLEEDMGFGDETSTLLIPSDLTVKAKVIAKAHGILAGVEEVKALLRSLRVRVIRSKDDGDRIAPGDVVMEIEGNARVILGAERTLLNILMHMSGIATMTKRLVDKARKRNPSVRIAATRKTLPGLRYFEKKAVRIGGGDTHRLRLDDMLLIKDNHLRIVGDVRRALELASSRSFSKKVEIEVTCVEDALEAAKAGADIIMLDNMKPMEIIRAVKLLEREGLRDKVLLEASGGIDEDNIEEYAATGVDVISLGMITHSSRAIDMSLEVEPPTSRNANRD
ncbi:MAG: carboxylating nicotinate-nucleotide diphosphorylase [Thermoprotei archaeon]|nr:carboxylating nicotinate-nucleotide diphosphorylase [Thermoprotei archaeon]